MTAADRPSVTPRVEPWPDGTRVRFTDAARQAMREPKHLGPLRTPKGGPDGTFTVENTDDTLHDVILVETGERWGALWLEEAPGEQPRPSVTDNARAEQRSGHTVQQTAAHFARKVQRVSDRIRSTDYQRSVSDIVALDNVEGFLDRIARDDLDVFAAGRAETTTGNLGDADDSSLHVPGRVPLLHARHAVTDVLAALHDARTTRDGQVKALDTARALERIRAAQSYLANAAAALEATAPAVADELDAAGPRYSQAGLAALKARRGAL